MRVRSAISILSFGVISAIGATWIKSHATARDLHDRLTALKVEREKALDLAQTRDRLRSALAEAALRRQADAEATSLTPDQSVSAPTSPSLLPLGEWQSATEWRNEGRSTARETVATMLWAAAGGDLTTMTQIITFDDAARKAARAFFETLPLATRHAFVTPEAVVASLTIQAIPESAAQLSWFHDRDADHATVGLLVAAPERDTRSEILAPASKDDTPPMLADDHATKLVVLSLERSAKGWSVAIPAAAIARLTRLHKSH